MGKCSLCKEEVSIWKTYSKDGEEYCPKCWNKMELEKSRREKDIEVSTEKRKKKEIEKDKEFVRSIYEKRKNHRDLTLKEKLRVVGFKSSLAIFWIITLFSLGIIGLIYFLWIQLKLSEFEGNLESSKIKNDYGIGKEF